MTESIKLQNAWQPGSMCCNVMQCRISRYPQTRRLDRTHRGVQELAAAPNTAQCAPGIDTFVRLICVAMNGAVHSER